MEKKIDYGLIILKMKSGRKEIIKMEKKMDYGLITLKAGSGKKKHTLIRT